MSTAPKRYLHVIQRYFPFRGGSERYFQAFSERFAACGDRVQVVTSDAWDLEYFWDSKRNRVDEACGRLNGVEILRVPVHHLPVATLTHRAIRRLMAESCRVSFPGREALLGIGSCFGPWLPTLDARLAELDRPDLVNSANIAFESMIAAAAKVARRHDVPHVVTPFLHFGESDDPKVRRYYTMPHQLNLLRRADGILVLTSIEADFLAQAGIDGTRIYNVGAGIDVVAVTGGDGCRQRERLSLDGPIVLSLGAAAYDKGTTHLIQAVSSLNRGGASVSLVIAGPVLSDVTEFARRLPPDELNQIHILGFVSEEERRDLLAACDLLALPSRTESFGLVFMEAWANKKPVVGARAGAIPAVVRDGVDGLLVDFGDTAALADAIDMLVNSSTLRVQLGTSGNAKVVDESVWFERVRRAYDTILGMSPRRIDLEAPRHGPIIRRKQFRREGCRRGVGGDPCRGSSQRWLCLRWRCPADHQIIGTH